MINKSNEMKKKKTAEMKEKDAGKDIT